MVASLRLTLLLLSYNRLAKEHELNKYAYLLKQVPQPLGAAPPDLAFRFASSLHSSSRIPEQLAKLITTAQTMTYVRYSVVSMHIRVRAFGLAVRRSSSFPGLAEAPPLVLLVERRFPRLRAT